MLESTQNDNRSSTFFRVLSSARVVRCVIRRRKPKLGCLIPPSFVEALVRTSALMTRHYDRAQSALQSAPRPQNNLKQNPCEFGSGSSGGEGKHQHDGTALSPHSKPTLRSYSFDLDLSQSCQNCQNTSPNLRITSSDIRGCRSSVSFSPVLFRTSAIFIPMLFGNSYQSRFLGK
jgi:hypothetical protein